MDYQYEKRLAMLLRSDWHDDALLEEIARYLRRSGGEVGDELDRAIRYSEAATKIRVLAFGIPLRDELEEKIGERVERVDLDNEYLVEAFVLWTNYVNGESWIAFHSEDDARKYAASWRSWITEHDPVDQHFEVDFMRAHARVDPDEAQDIVHQDMQGYHLDIPTIYSELRRLEMDDVLEESPVFAGGRSSLEEEITERGNAIWEYLESTRDYRIELLELWMERASLLLLAAREEELSNMIRNDPIGYADHVRGIQIGIDDLPGWIYFDGIDYDLEASRWAESINLASWFCLLGPKVVWLPSGVAFRRC